MTELPWLLAFVLTIGIELPIVAACAARGLRGRAANDSVWANVLTHPLAWLAIATGSLPWVPTELGVTLVEALIYRGVTGLRWARAVTAALLANCVTASLSLAW